MQMRTWIITCLAVSAVWSLALLLIPAFADLVESLMLLFLSTNAR